MGALNRSRKKLFMPIVCQKIDSLPSPLTTQAPPTSQTSSRPYSAATKTTCRHTPCKSPSIRYFHRGRHLPRAAAAKSHLSQPSQSLDFAERPNDTSPESHSKDRKK